MASSIPDQRMISTKQLALRTNEPYDTLNHWARMGLLPYKKKGKTRFFVQKSTIALCKRIRRLQNDDLNLVAIRRILSGKKRLRY